MCSLQITDDQHYDKRKVHHYINTSAIINNCFCKAFKIIAQKIFKCFFVAQTLRNIKKKLYFEQIKESFKT